MNSNTLEIEVPVGQSGQWRVEEFTVSESDSKFTEKLAAIRGCRDEFVPAGTYKKLVFDDVVVMSNTPMEIRTNKEFIRRAKGNVLINGLGLGMVLTAILKKPEVNSVTVVEISEDVISLTGPTFASDPRVKIVHCSAFDYKPAKGERFDCVYHDIWPFITDENLADMKVLHRKYSRRADWQASWAYLECLRFARRMKNFR